MTDGPHILIVGAGSVGRRHAGNLRGLGARLSGVDPRADRRQAFAADFEAATVAADLDAALAADEFDAIAICSPTAFHVEQAMAGIAAGLPILLEKPLAMDLASGETLAAALANGGPPLLLGYTWRWWPPLRELRRRLGEGAIGPLRHGTFVMSAHLADWHPDEPLDAFFMAHAELGGGALLDESHWLDQAIWLLGMPARVSGRVERIGDLPITSDDNVDALLIYDDGRRVALHLDLFGRPHQKTIRLIGAAGTLLWSEQPNELAQGTGAAGATGTTDDWHRTVYDCQRNDMFVAVAAEFLAVIDGAAPSCGIDDGLAAMRLIEAIRRASAGGETVTV